LYIGTPSISIPITVFFSESVTVSIRPHAGAQLAV
jgi:hypothetical protein